MFWRENATMSFLPLLSSVAACSAEQQPHACCHFKSTPDLSADQILSHKRVFWEAASGTQRNLTSPHLSLNCKGHWGTTDDFTTSFLHLSVFSTALWTWQTQACPFPGVFPPPHLPTQRNSSFKSKTGNMHWMSTFPYSHLEGWAAVLTFVIVISLTLRWRLVHMSREMVGLCHCRYHCRYLPHPNPYN